MKLFEILILARILWAAASTRASASCRAALMALIAPELTRNATARPAGLRSHRGRNPVQTAVQVTSLFLLSFLDSSSYFFCLSIRVEPGLFGFGGSVSSSGDPLWCQNKRIRWSFESIFWDGLHNAMGRKIQFLDRFTDLSRETISHFISTPKYLVTLQMIKSDIILI